MKRKMAVLISIILVLPCFSACTSSQKASTGSATSSQTEKKGDKESEKSGSDKKSYTIKLAHGAAEAVPMHKGALKFKEVVEEQSGGRIKVEVYPNQMLGGDREFTEAVQMGNIQMGIPSCTPVANFVSELYLFDTPFAFSSREQAFEILDGEVGQKIMATLSKVGIKGLGIWENGFRNLTCNDDPKTTPEKLRGVKVRTMENDVHLEIWKSLGANPTPMAFGELYTALQQKTIDAQENPMSLIYNTKYYEVQDYVVETRHIYTPYLVLINEEFFNSLDEEDQNIIFNAYNESTKLQREVAATDENECREKLNELCEVVQLTDEEREVFIEKTAHVREMVKEKCGNPELADEFFAAIDAK